MAKYRIEGVVVDTDNATARWECTNDHDGRNFICRHTGSQWDHQTLYRSRRGRYYVVSESAWQGSRPHAEWLSPEAAARWLLLNGNKVPTDLAEAAESVSE